METIIDLIIILMAGFSGGAVRGLVGFLKHYSFSQKTSFNWTYFLSMTFLSGIIGLVATLSLKESGSLFGFNIFNPGLAIIIGYAGSDFLENAAKILLKKESFFNK
jgi:hypothetical protein